MSLYGGLAENTRRNERVERGSVTTVAGVATVGFTSTQTVNLTNAPGSVGGMRQMTHFALTIDDAGVAADGVTATKPAVVTGSLNAAGTILTINAYVATSNANPTLIQTAVVAKVRYVVWGNLSGGQGF